MDNQLAHHGILGMKWGVRRYQNADGSLTKAGKQHYKENNSSSSSAKKINEKNSEISETKASKQARNDIKKQRKLNAKNASLLSDAELNSQINRLQRERQLKQLTSEVVTPGRYKAKEMLRRYGGQALSIATGGVVSGIGMRYVNAFMDVQLAKQGFKVKGYNSDGTPNYGGGNNKDDD